MSGFDEGVGLGEKLGRAKERVEAFKRKLESAEAEVRRLEDHIRSRRNGSGATRADDDEFASEVPTEGSLAARIIAMAKAEPGKSFSADVVMQRFSGAEAKSVRSTLARLAREKKLSRPRRGRYRIAAA